MTFPWHDVTRQALCREVEPDSRWHTHCGLDYRVQIGAVASVLFLLPR